MGDKAGPSPLVPSLLVGVLGLIIYGPTLLSFSGAVVPTLFEAGESIEGRATVVFVMVLLILVLLLVHFLSSFYSIPGVSSFSSYYSDSSSSYDADSFGFGLGSFLLLVLFFLLYNLV